MIGILHIIANAKLSGRYGNPSGMDPGLSYFLTFNEASGKGGRSLLV